MGRDAERADHQVNYSLISRVLPPAITPEAGTAGQEGRDIHVHSHCVECVGEGPVCGGKVSRAQH